jgi:ferrous-iron efflux pump FieF
MKDPNKLMRLSTYVTVSGVSLIIIAKIYGCIITGSVTMLASLVDSLLDVCVSIMNLVAVHYSLQPADQEHRFGHNKIEDIAVFLQSGFFAASGVFLIYASLVNFFNGDVATRSGEGIEILFFSLIVTVVIVTTQRYVMKFTKSNVIAADSMHYFVDLISNICAIIGIFIVTYWHLNIFDNITAILIAFYIIFNAIKMFKDAFNNLMDHEMSKENRKIIIDIIANNKKVLGFHDLKTRNAGIKSFIQIHLELDKNMTINQAHTIAIEIENEIVKKFPNAEVIIHQDPEGVEEDVSYKD